MNEVQSLRNIKSGLCPVATLFEKITHFEKSSKCVQFGTNSTHFKKLSFKER